MCARIAAAPGKLSKNCASVSPCSGRYWAHPGGAAERDGWDHHKERLSGADMTYTFKLARRLARSGRVAFWQSFSRWPAPRRIHQRTATGPRVRRISSIDVFRDSASVGVDGEVQFDAQAGNTASASWWRGQSAGEGESGFRRIRRRRFADVQRDRPDAVGLFDRLLLKWSATGGTVNETCRYVAARRQAATSSSPRRRPARPTLRSSSSPAPPGIRRPPRGPQS